MGGTPMPLKRDTPRGIPQWLGRPAHAFAVSKRAHSPPRQRTAVELLLRGAGDADVGQQLGVDRGTVFRWRTQHAAFRAELERQRELAFQESVDRLRSMVQPALDIIERQMGDASDPRAALRAAAILLRFAAPRRPTTGSSSAGASAAARPTAPSDTWDWIEAYVNAPLPGQPGAPEDLARAFNEAAADDDDDGDDLDDE